MRLLLDSQLVGRLCHPRHPGNQPLVQWLAKLLRTHAGQVRVVIPEISDYETRRGLLHLALRNGLDEHPRLRRLNALGQKLVYLPLTTHAMRRAAKIWAEARHRGRPTSDERSLDGDAILAAQALEVDGVVVTENTKHFVDVAPACHWQEVSERLSSSA